MLHITPIPRSGALIAAIVAAVVVGVAMMPAAASAASTWWRAGSLCAGCSDAGPTRTQLTSSFALAESYSRKIRAGAHWAGNWQLHGSWAEGWGEACQNYPGWHLGALINNPHTVGQNDVWALDGWVSNGQGSYC